MFVGFPSTALSYGVGRASLQHLSKDRYMPLGKALSLAVGGKLGRMSEIIHRKQYGNKRNTLLCQQMFLDYS